MVDLIPILRTEINFNQPTKEVGALANCHINRIDKKAFLAAFLTVYKDVFSSSNIRSGFRATGLVPIDPEVVISKLEIKPHTPTPPPPPPITAWQPKTPSNATEIDAQSTLILDQIQTHASSSPASIIKIVEQFKKGAKIIVHSQALLATQVAQLEAANGAATERKQRKKQQI
jgi:hypothetical protein